eukprot:GILI01006719.1.p1 GENE.GILI01006719.1~~GILI01006719.1.p1  ORF type:complete len:187 (+),score=15.78 GILI01006719.1:47-562(+)
MVQTDLAAQFGMQMMGYPNPYPTGMPTPYPLYSYFPQMMMPSPLPAMPAALATAPSTQEDAVVRTVDDTVRTAKSDLGAERIKPSSEPTVAATSETALPQPITTPPAGMLFYPPPPMMYMPGAGYVAPYPQQPYFIPVPMSGAFPQGYGMHPMFALPQIQPPATTPGPDKK